MRANRAVTGAPYTRAAHSGWQRIFMRTFFDTKTLSNIFMYTGDKDPVRQNKQSPKSLELG